MDKTHAGPKSGRKILGTLVCWVVEVNLRKREVITMGDTASRAWGKGSQDFLQPRNSRGLDSGRGLSQLHVFTMEPLLPPQACSSHGSPHQGLSPQPLTQPAAGSFSSPWLSASIQPPPGPASATVDLSLCPLLCVPAAATHPLVPLPPLFASTHCCAMAGVIF